MKTKLLALMVLAGGSLFAETHFSVGIGVGGYGYADRPVVAYAPPCPGPGYSWVDGYWDYAGPRRFWHTGYWAPPVYGRYRVEPRYDRYRYNDNRYGRERYEDRSRSFRSGWRAEDRDVRDGNRNRDRYDRR